jgi:hypothetical protein
MIALGKGGIPAGEKIRYFFENFTGQKRKSGFYLNHIRVMSKTNSSTTANHLRAPARQGNIQLEILPWIYIIRS